jgi:uncharacterized Fe-S cluster-containing MiaB family protein
MERRRMSRKKYVKKKKDIIQKKNDNVSASAIQPKKVAATPKQVKTRVLPTRGCTKKSISDSVNTES